MGIQLDQIVPWGRTAREYRAMFRLGDEDLRGGVLDGGGGPSGFAAELASQGLPVCSIDPIYAFTGREIQARFEAVVPSMMTQVRATAGSWVWEFHRDPDALLAARRAAMEAFLSDYEAGRRVGRYVVGSLTDPPYAAGSIGLALCSHLLFLYSDQLTAEFHGRAVAAMCRVAREVRIFPLLTLSGHRSPHLEGVVEMVRRLGWAATVERVPYALQRGGNEMLRLQPAGRGG